MYYIGIDVGGMSIKVGVVDADGKLLGALHMHDLMDAKVI